MITRFLSLFLLTIPLFGSCFLQPVESYYTVKDFGCPHFHTESLDLDTQSFVNLINEVNQKTHDRAFLIEMPNKLYSDNIEKLRAAQFFHYYDYPERDASVWCRTNGSGIPLAASHTLGARSLVYYKDNSEYYFLLIKDRYSHNGRYEVPGGYVQPDDSDIVNAFEQGQVQTTNLDYHSPEETAINEVLEETNFDLTHYGYSPEGTKKPLTIALIHTKNTRPDRGIHSVNDACLYLLFKVIPNQDPLKIQDHEISDVRWTSYQEIINNQIPSQTGIHSTTDNIKELVQRVVAADKYKETRRQLITINKQLQELISSDSTNALNTEQLKRLIGEQLELLKLQHALELKLKQRYFLDGNKRNVTYFTPL